MSLKRDALANYLGQAWGAAMALAFIPVYIRYLGIESYGLVGLFAVIQTCMTLLDFGMTPTLNREMAKFRASIVPAKEIIDLLRTFEIVVAVLGGAIFLGLWGASDWLARDWLKPSAVTAQEASLAISVMALVVATRFVESVYKGALLGLGKQVWFNSVASVFATLRWAGAAAAVAFVSPTLYAFFLTQAIVSLGSLLVLAAKVWRTLPALPVRPRFSRPALRSVQRFAAGMAGLSVLTLVLTQADKIILSRLLPLGDFAYYTLVATICSAVYLLVAPLTQALFPRLVALHASQEKSRFASLYHLASQTVTVLVAPLCMVLVLHGAGLVFLWSGDAALAHNSGSLLSVFALGAFLNALMYMPSQAQVAAGWTGLQLRMNALASIVLVWALLVYVPRFGVMGAAVIWVGLNVFYVIFGIAFMHQRILEGEMKRWYLSDIVRPLGAGLAWALVLLPAAPSALESRSRWLAYLATVAMGSWLASLLAAPDVRARLFDNVRALHSAR